MHPHAGNQRPSARRAERVVVIAAIAAVLGFYYWVVATHDAFSAARGGSYGLLVKGYLKGQLNLDATPDPHLAALPDPYDPGQNEPYRLADASYFNGKYYFYFGPAPALLLMLPFEAVTGREFSTGATAFVFAVVLFGTATVLWLSIRARYFPRSALAIAVLGVFVLGLSSHVLAVLARPLMWEMSIVAGGGFVMLALLAVHCAIEGRRPGLAMVFAGFFVGCGAASRAPAILAAVMLVPPVWHAWRFPAGRPRWRTLALAAGIPLGVCVSLLLWHNYARFGNPLEFGQRYQLSIAYEGHMQHFSLRYLAHNFFVYFLRPPNWTLAFPFVSAPHSWAPIPGYFGGEEVCALAFTFPIAGFALLAPLACRGRAREDRGKLLAQIGAVTASFVALAGLLLVFFSSTERYMTDFTPLLVLLALIGVLGVERAIRGPCARRVFQITLGCTGAYSVILGLLVYFDYHGRFFETECPVPAARIRKAQAWITEAGVRATGSYRGPGRFSVAFARRPAGTVEAIWRTAREEVQVEYLEDRRVRLGYRRENGPTRWSLPQPYQPGRPYPLQLQLPSFYDRSDGLLAVVRPLEWYRERSAVAIWYDGRRIVGLIVPPHVGVAEDGRAGGSFSGTIARTGRRLFRTDELPMHDFAGWSVVVAAPENYGEAKVLLKTGADGHGETLALECAGKGRGRLTFQSSGRAARYSAEFPLSTGDVVADIEHAPIYPWSAGENEQQPMEVWIDGRLVWRTSVTFHKAGPGQVVLGEDNTVDERRRRSARHRVSRQNSIASTTLHLRFVLPTNLDGVGLPLLVEGVPYGADYVGIRRASDHEAELFLDHTGFPMRVGPRGPIEVNEVTTADISLPATSRSPAEASRLPEVVLKLNGESGPKIHSALFAVNPDDKYVGRNPLGGTTCAAEFTGWLLSARWSSDPESAQK